MQTSSTSRGGAAARGRASRDFLCDCVAAATLWAVYSSQALAYSRLALATPAAGLVTAVAGAAIYAALGSSWRISIGPAGGICAIVGATMAGVPREHLAASIAALTLMAAGFLFIGGCLRITFLQRLFPEPVFVGYLAGTGITILIGQVKELTSSGPGSLGLGALSIAALLLLGRFWSRVPAPFVVIALATTVSAVLALKDRGIPVLGSGLGHFGALSSPTGLDGSAWAALVAPALSIALFVYVDTLANIEAFEREGDPAPQLRREYFALGAVNLVAGLFGGFVAGCSTSRTAVSIDAGARSRWAPGMAGALLFLASLSLVRFLEPLPLAALSGVVIVAAVGLVDVRRLCELRALRAADFRIALAAALSVVVVGPMWGVGIGVAAALFEAFRRAMLPERQVLARGAGERYYVAFEPDALPVIDGLLVYRFGAPMFFGNADVFLDDMRQAGRAAAPSLQTLIVNSDGLGVPDATARSALRKSIAALKGHGVNLVFGNVRADLRSALTMGGPFTIMDEPDFIAAVIRVRGGKPGALPPAGAK